MPELEKMEQLRVDNLKMNKSILDLTEEEMDRRVEREIKYEKVVKTKGGSSFRSLVKQHAFTPNSVTKPEGELFNEKRLEELATTTHIISEETRDLGKNIFTKRNKNYEIDQWPEFNKQKQPLRPTFTLSEESEENSEEDEVQELVTVHRKQPNFSR